MIEGANCYECGRCNGGDVCRNPDTYSENAKRGPRKVEAKSWLIQDAGSVGLLVSNTESSTALVLSPDMATAFVVNLIRNIESSYKTTTAAKARLLATITEILSEE